MGKCVGMVYHLLAILFSQEQPSMVLLNAHLHLLLLHHQCRCFIL